MAQFSDGRALLETADKLSGLLVDWSVVRPRAICRRSRARANNAIGPSLSEKPRPIPSSPRGRFLGNLDKGIGVKRVPVTLRYYPNSPQDEPIEMLAVRFYTVLHVDNIFSMSSKLNKLYRITHIDITANNYYHSV